MLWFVSGFVSDSLCSEMGYYSNDNGDGYITDGAFGYPAAIFVRRNGYDSPYQWLDIEYEYANEIVLPEYEGANEVTITEILVEQGDTVSQGQAVMRIDINGVSEDITATASGQVTHILVTEGELIPIEDEETRLVLLEHPCMQKVRFNINQDDCFSTGENYALDKQGKPIVKNVNYRSIGEFLAERKKRAERSVSKGGTGEDFHWPSFEQRMQEMNNERSGDVIVITDGREGYLALDNAADSYRGWHGGPTESESYVPLMFSMPGTGFVDDSGERISGAPDSFKNAVKTALMNNEDSSSYNRNWHLPQGLSAGINALRANPE